MGDSRNRTLKALVNSYRFLEQTKKFHMQCIDAEERALRDSNDNWESAHKTFERLENLQELQGLWNEYQRQEKKIKSTIQTFLEFNEDLSGTKYYLEATKLIQEQKALECPNTEQMKGRPDGANPLLEAAEKKVENIDSQDADIKLSKAE